jgi:hypothetical protein
VAIDVTIAGKRFGHLPTACGRGRGNDITCRCVCGRLVRVAAESLVDGTITSCGCQPASPEFWTQHTELRAQQRREISFSIARAR